MIINQLHSFEEGMIALDSCFDKRNPKFGILVIKFETALISITVSPYDGVVAACLSQDFGSDHYRLAPEQHWTCMEDWIGNRIEWYDLDDDPEVTWIHLYNSDIDKDAPLKEKTITE